MQLVRGAVVLQTADDRLVGEDGLAGAGPDDLAGAVGRGLGGAQGLGGADRLLLGLGRVTAALSEATLMAAFVALVTPSVLPDFAV